MQKDNGKNKIQYTEIHSQANLFKYISTKGKIDLSPKYSLAEDSANVTVKLTYRRSSKILIPYFCVEHTSSEFQLPRKMNGK